MTEWLESSPQILVYVNPELGVSVLHEYLGSDATPPWLLKRVLPYEIGLLMHSDYDAARCTATIFVNSKRLTPMMTKQLRQSDLTSYFGPFTVQRDSVLEIAPGVLTLTATAQFEPLVARRALRHSETSAITFDSSNSLEHFLELRIDNRTGTLYALLGLLVSNGFLSLERTGIDEDRIAEFLSKIASATLFADYDNGRCVVDVIIDCAPVASKPDLESLNSLTTFCGHLAGSSLREYGVEVHGSSQVRNGSVLGRYTIENLDAVARAYAASRGNTKGGG